MTHSLKACPPTEHLHYGISTHNLSAHSVLYVHCTVLFSSCFLYTVPKYSESPYKNEASVFVQLLCTYRCICANRDRLGFMQRFRFVLGECTFLASFAFKIPLKDGIIVTF